MHEGLHFRSFLGSPSSFCNELPAASGFALDHAHENGGKACELRVAESEAAELLVGVLVNQSNEGVLHQTKVLTPLHCLIDGHLEADHGDVRREFGEVHFDDLVIAFSLAS